MMYDPSLLVYIVDTRALFWYLKRPGQLSPAADAVFRLAAVGGAQIVAPAIVVAELFYLGEKTGVPLLPSTLLDDINHSREFIFSELGQAQLESMETVDWVPEMHDRLIAAEALVFQAPIISRDEALGASGVVDVIW
jgi:PIN domain nuclease of toxin-antitoxin system